MHTATARKILVVCLGNHCRSPLAAAILAHRGGAAVDVRSAGLSTRRLTDEPAHPLMKIAASELGYDLTDHRGVQITTELLEWADLVLAMDQTIFTRLHQLAGPTDSAKIRLYLPANDVPDPWEKDAAAFTACAALIAAGADRHLT
jgi:protein-tyrosine phosphatase